MQLAAEIRLSQKRVHTSTVQHADQRPHGQQLPMLSVTGSSRLRCSERSLLGPFHGHRPEYSCQAVTLDFGDMPN